MDDTKVIGYFAQKSPTELFCDERALVITGSESLMKQALALHGQSPASAFTIRKTRFRDILAGIQYGGAYAFDEESYRRFAPLAETFGIPRQDFDFTPSKGGKLRLLVLDPKISG